jgi:hypothetical protein
VVALAELASEALEEVSLSRCFDALSEHAFVHRFGNADDALDDAARGIRGVELVNERLVDLENVEGQVIEIGE